MLEMYSGGMFEQRRTLLVYDEMKQKLPKKKETNKHEFKKLYVTDSLRFA